MADDGAGSGSESDVRPSLRTDLPSIDEAKSAGAGAGSGPSAPDSDRESDVGSGGGAVDLSKLRSYNIRVELGDSAWDIERRYRQFAILHEQLGSHHKERLSKLPGKTLARNPKNPKFIHERRAKLEAYIQSIVEDPVLREHKAFQSFVGVDLKVLRRSTGGYTSHDWVSRTGGRVHSSRRQKRMRCLIL